MDSLNIIDNTMEMPQDEVHYNATRWAKLVDPLDITYSVSEPNEQGLSTVSLVSPSNGTRFMRTVRQDEELPSVELFNKRFDNLSTVFGKRLDTFSLWKQRLIGCFFEYDQTWLIATVFDTMTNNKARFYALYFDESGSHMLTYDFDPVKPALNRFAAEPTEQGTKDAKRYLGVLRTLSERFERAKDSVLPPGLDQRVHRTVRIRPNSIELRRWLEDHVPNQPRNRQDQLVKLAKQGQQVDSPTLAYDLILKSARLVKPYGGHRVWSASSFRSMLNGPIKADLDQLAKAYGIIEDTH